MNSKKHIVYVIRSNKDGVLYIGCTVDLGKRIIEHNSGLSEYTSSRMPWSLIWYCVFYDKYKAYGFEKYLKTASGKAFLNKRFI